MNTTKLQYEIMVSIAATTKITANLPKIYLIHDPISLLIKKEKKALKFPLKYPYSMNCKNIIFPHRIYTLPKP